MGREREGRGDEIGGLVDGGLGTVDPWFPGLYILHIGGFIPNRALFQTEP